MKHSLEYFVKEKKELRILSLDPSVALRCGWAAVVLEWSKDGELKKENWDFGSWELNGMNYQMRCSDLKDHIIQMGFPFDQLVCEWPKWYESDKGQVAARQGYTINLAGLVMYIAGYFQINFRNLFLYTAPDWKGTVKKKVTAHRFFKLFGLAEPQVNHDTVDAAMMLVYHCRKLSLIM